MSEKAWKHLVRKPRSVYKQLFVKDCWIAARTLYGQTIGEESRTPAEVAADYSLPLEVVLEAIAYCETMPVELSEDWEREEESIHLNSIESRNGRHKSPLLLTPQD